MGQQVVTELVIDSSGATAGANQFESAMGSAEAAARKTVGGMADLSGGIGQTISALGGLAALFTGGVVIAGLTGFIDQIVKANKSLADMQTMAKQTGLTLADFQGLQFGGAVAGLTPDQLNEGLQKSAKLLNDASRNSNSLSKELAENGINIKNANGQLISQNQLLGIAADLIKRAKNPGDANAIAEMLGFTKEWIPLLEQGSSAMSGLTAEARLAGAVIDDETINRATEFDKQWRKSSVEFSSYMKAAMLGLLPLLDDLIDRAQQFIKSIDAKKIEAAANEQLKALAEPVGLPDEAGLKISITPEAKKAAQDILDAPSMWEGFIRTLQIFAANKPIGAVQSIDQKDLKWSAGANPVMDTSDATVSAAKNVAAWTAEGQAWKKLSDDIVSGADKMVGGFSKVAAKDVANDQYDRAVITAKRHTDQLYAEADALGLGAGALAKFKTEAQLTSAAEAAGLPLTAARIAQIKELGLDAQDAANDLAKLKVASQADFARKTAFLSQEDVAIARQLSDVYGNDVSKALASSEAQAIRLNNSLKQVNDIVGTGVSSFAKDVANGVAPMEAFANAAKRAAESVLDIATKKIASNLLGGLLGDTASQATGATTAAGILTSAGATVAASIVAGATEAAGILGLSVPSAAAALPAAGAATGTEVGAGGIVAGGALAEGGVVVEGAALTLSAAMGPIALAFAAIAAIAALIGLSGGQSKADKWLQGQIEGRDSRLADIAQRSAMVGVDTNTRQGAILAQDAQFVQQRIQENKDGGQAMNALLQVQVQERNQLLKDWDQKDTDLLKANADAKLAIEKAANDRALGFQNRLFAATNDFSTLEGQLAAFDRSAAQERLQEAANDNNRLADLDAATAAERFNVIKTYNDKIVADTQAAAKAQQDAMNATAKNITDFVNGLYAGPNTTSSPTARRAAAGTVYNTELALAQTGDAGAQARITTDAQNLLDAERAISASSVAFQQLRDNVAAQLLSLPSVQNTTDPAVQAMRDVLTAINIGNQVLNVINATTGGTTSAVNASNSVGTLTGVILPAVNAGNAAAVASALQSYFNQIDPSGKLASIVNTTSATSVSTNSMDYAIDRNNQVTVAANNIAIYASGIASNQVTLLDAIKTLTSTSTTQLTLLTAALKPSSISMVITKSGNTTPGGGAGPVSGPDPVLQNQVVDALNKIVWNTYVISQNTEYTDSDVLKGHGGKGSYAQGGWITGGTPGVDSVRILAMQDEFMVRRSATQALMRDYGPGVMDMINAGRLPSFNDNRPINVSAPVFRGGGGNSNAELIAAIARLEARLDRIEGNTGNTVKAVLVTGNQTVKTVKDAAGEICDELETSGKRAAFAISQNSKKVA